MIKLFSLPTFSVKIPLLWISYFSSLVLNLLAPEYPSWAQRAEGIQDLKCPSGEASNLISDSCAAAKSNL